MKHNYHNQKYYNNNNNTYRDDSEESRGSRSYNNNRQKNRYKEKHRTYEDYRSHRSRSRSDDWRNKYHVKSRNFHQTHQYRDSTYYRSKRESARKHRDHYDRDKRYNQKYDRPYGSHRKHHYDNVSRYNKPDQYQRHRYHKDYHRSETSERDTSYQQKRHQKLKQRHHHHKQHRSSSQYSYRSKSSKSSSSKSSSSKKDAGHLEYEIGKIIYNKYEVIKHLGDGTFGRCYLIEDLKTKQQFAMKVIRQVDRYEESARIEVNILKYLNERDEDDQYGIVRFYEDFTFENSYCLIFEVLGMSLYDLIKKNGYKGFPMRLVQSFFKQILISVGFLHSQGLTHTDLKPENILIVNPELTLCQDIPNYLDEKKANFKSSSERSSTASEIKRHLDRPYYLPAHDQIKLIDLGGATFDKEYHSSIINTRQYRAPEVILGCCKWNNLSDLWSVGCIVLELITGELYFETHESYEHVAMIEKSQGHFPFWMAQKAQNEFEKHFVTNSESCYRKYNTYFDWPKYASSNDSIKRLKKMKIIKDIFGKRHQELQDLLNQVLEIDPKKRIDCKNALKHAFFDVNYQ